MRKPHRHTDLDEPTLDEADYRSVLGDLIAAYESESDSEPRTSPAELLRFMIESKGTAQAKFAARTGVAESTISEILAGKRKISEILRRSLVAYFRVDPGINA